VIVSYVGHATVELELDGIRLLTDPLLRARVAHLRRVAPLPEVSPKVDAVLVSHAHHDHLDLPSLKLLPASTLVVVPCGAGRLLRRFDRVVELDEGDEVEVGPLHVRALHAEHPGGRSPLRARGPALSYAILGTRRAYFAGDTGLFRAMEGLVPELDLALLPIWGWGPRLGPGHLDPRSAAEALRLLRPLTAVPIHWGTYRMLHQSREVDPAVLEEPTKAFARAAAELAPEVEVRILRPGEKRVLLARQ
jgi:L-ascorbate metabolism protein UlaG (beta-lactamase superfamily)